MAYDQPALWRRHSSDDSGGGGAHRSVDTDGSRRRRGERFDVEDVMGRSTSGARASRATGDTAPRSEAVDESPAHSIMLAWWQEHSHLGIAQRVTRFFREVLLAALPEPVVIFVDEIDTALSQPYADDF